MSTSDSPTAANAAPDGNLKNDPKSVKIDVTGGTGVEIVWKDLHRSSYTFPFLRDACPCALCDDDSTPVRLASALNWRSTIENERAAYAGVY